MFKAWKSKETDGLTEITSTGLLLSKVMYDAKPETYGSYEDLRNILSATGGDLTTVDHHEFNGFLEETYDNKTILDLLKDQGIEITVRGGERHRKNGIDLSGRNSKAYR